MRIIDAHIHFCPAEQYFSHIASAAGHENNEDHLRRAFAAEGIEMGVVMGNGALSPQHHDYPGFLRYCAGLDSTCFRRDTAEGAVALVEQHLQRKACVGIKIYAGYCPYYVHDEVYHPFYHLARRYGKPVAIHTGALAGVGGLLKYSHPLSVDEVAGAFPDVQFILCHFGNPWVVDAAAVMEKNSNVAADLSGLIEGFTDMDLFLEENADYLRYLKTWLGYVGYDRVMYGTDWPLANIGNYLQLTRSLIPQRHWPSVFFHNANRLYRLGLGE